MPMRAATLSITSPGPIIQVTVSPPVPGSELLLGGDPPTSFTIMDGDPEDGVFELDLTDVLPMDVDDVYILYLLETQSQDAIPFLTASATEPVTQTPLAYVGAPLPVCCMQGRAPSLLCVFHRAGHADAAGLRRCASPCVVHGNTRVSSFVLHRRPGTLCLCVASKANATEPVTQTPLAYVGAPLPAWYTKTPESLPVCCIEGPAHSFCVFHRKGAFA